MSDWLQKANELKTFIGLVGIPAMIIIVFLVLIAGTWMGYFDSPLVSKRAFEHHERVLNEAVNELESQTRVLEQLRMSLRSVRCEVKQTVNERVRCFNRLAQDHN